MHAANVRCMHRTRYRRSLGKTKHPTSRKEVQLPQQQYPHVPAAASAILSGIRHDEFGLWSRQRIPAQQAIAVLVQAGYRGTDEVLLARCLYAMLLEARCLRHQCQPCCAELEGPRAFLESIEFGKYSQQRARHFWYRGLTIFSASRSRPPGRKGR